MIPIKAILHGIFACFISGLVIVSILTGCESETSISGLRTSATAPMPSVTATFSPSITQTSPALLPTPLPSVTAQSVQRKTIWFSKAVPEGLRQKISLTSQLMEVAQPGVTSIRLEPLKAAKISDTHWVYTLVMPFPSLVDEVQLSELQRAWSGEKLNIFEGHRLMVSASTQAAFEVLWGPASSEGVEVVSADQLLERAWSTRPAWALIPFEDLQPRWKVLRIDGLSPLDRGMQTDRYPLIVNFGWVDVDGKPIENAEPQLPTTNRDEQKMTVLLMTGTTALVRGIALRMEEMGVEYPAQQIGSLLQSADLTHISNEVPFDPKCPPAKPLRKEIRFCSSPSYIKLLKTVGADIIELTGNHLNDWGGDVFRYTLNLYRQEGFSYFGGGYNQEDARKPLLIENHGNRLAFIGCNPMGPAEDLATETRPGAAACNLDWMENEVHRLSKAGYLVIVTFQHFEVDDFKPQSQQRIDMQRMASGQDGAVIVSGSQAHFPQSMTLISDHFVHYGLGNLFFDQMTGYNRQAFIDRHIFYEGRYLGTELITIQLEDSAQPRLMTSEERAKLLKWIFPASGW